MHTKKRLHLLLLALVTSCTGAIGGGGGGGDDAPGPASGSPASKPADPSAASTPSTAAPTTVDGKPIDPNLAGSRPLRRLTRLEYNNTVRDLLGDASGPASAFPDDPVGAHGFAIGGNVSPVDATAIQEAADRLAADAVKSKLATLVPCNPAMGDDACAKRFIAAFGRKLFRRPLTTDEQSALEGLYATARTRIAYDFPQSVRVVLAGMLQAPQFLYHWEMGPQAPARAGKLVALTPFELASRLSYFFWASTPDDELLTAAETGKLASADDVAAQARRLLASPKARASVDDFFTQWLDLDRVGKVSKDPSFKEWTPQARAGALAETTRFVEAVVFEGDATVKTLLSAPFSFLNQPLAAVYGVTAVTGTTMQRIDLDPTQRAGLLTQATFLAAQAGATETSPVKRGRAVLTQLLCTSIEPPPEVPPFIPPTPTARTVRQRAEQQMQAPGTICAGCHGVINPIGYGFENYDAIARYRTMEKTDPIDATGSVTLASGKVSFANGVQLARALAGAPDVQDCVARQMLRYALGRAEEADDAGALATAQQTLRKGGNLRDLLAALAQTRSFTYRLVAAGEPL